MEEQGKTLHTAAAGIAGIAAARTAPAVARDRGVIRIGQIGLGGHDFLRPFNNPPKSFTGKLRCKPYMVWDETPGAAETIMDIGFEKKAGSLEELIRECDAIHFEHADFRKGLEYTRPALEAGKPVFYDRPFAYTIADAEEVIRLARTHDAPVMGGSSLEFQPVIAEMRKFAREAGPVSFYEAFCPEPVFSWMFPHVIYFAHAGLGGGIESAYFSGDYFPNPENWAVLDMVMDGAIDLTNFPKGFSPDYAKPGRTHRPAGSAVSVLTYRPRDNRPPMLGINVIGENPGTYHIDVYAQGGKRTFTAGADLFDHMFHTLHAFYADRKVPRPYDAMLEQHRALVATNVSRLTGRAVHLDSLGAGDAVPWHDEMRNYQVRYRLAKKKG